MPFQQHGTYFYFECSELRHFQSLKIPTAFGSELLLRSPHLLQNATFAKREDHFAWDPQEQGVILGAFYYGYIWTQVGLLRWHPLLEGKVKKTQYSNFEIYLSTNLYGSL